MSDDSSQKPWSLYTPENVRGSVSSIRPSEWVEESFVELNRGHGAWSLPKSKEFLTGLFSLKKSLIAFTLGMCALSVVLGRVIYLQLVRGSEYQALAEGNRVRTVLLPAERGIIFDVNGKPLVKNVPTFSITLSPRELPRDATEREETLRSIASLAGTTYEELDEYLRSYSTYSFEAVTLKENVPYEIALKTLIKNVDIPALGIRQEVQREYIHYEDAKKPAFTLSHVVGYQSKISPDDLKQKQSLGYLPTDFIGRTGIEASFESFLRGVYGKRRVEVDAAGNLQSVIAEERSVPGRDVVLSVDVEYQNTLEKIMQTVLAVNGKKRAVAVVMDPTNGSVRALVSFPSFDNNVFARGVASTTYAGFMQDQNRPLFNRAVSGVYPSGSTVKPLIAAAALQENIINEHTSFSSTGGMQVGEHFFPDWKAGGHGVTDVVKALAESVNTFFYMVGGGKEDRPGLGIERIKWYLNQYGLGHRLGIELPSEAEGNVPDPEWKESVKKERWYIGDTYNVSIGQGDLLVTPLQVAAFTAAVANGGTLYRPRIAEKVVDPADKTEQIIEKQILTQNTVSSYNMNIVRNGMRECVRSGSCRALQALPIATAGKTGTAQWSSRHPNHAWFTGFAPFNTPQIVVTVLVEEGGEGSAVAPPIARDFLQWWYSQKK